MKYTFPVIPTLCLCGCNEVLWHRGQKYVSGHDSKHHPYWKGSTRDADTKLKISLKIKALIDDEYLKRCSASGKKAQQLHPEIAINLGRYVKNHLEICSIAGKIGNKAQLEKYPTLRSEVAKRNVAGTSGFGKGATKENSSMGGKIAQKLHPEIVVNLVQYGREHPEEHSLAGKRCKELHPNLGKENMLRFLHSHGVEHDGRRFLSKQETKCYDFLKSCGLTPEKDFFYNFIVGDKSIDFYIPDNKIFWEHHPKVFWNKETTAEYYKKRREILDTYGFLDSRLIVTIGLNELHYITEALNESIMV